MEKGTIKKFIKKNRALIISSAVLITSGVITGKLLVIKHKNKQQQLAMADKLARAIPVPSEFATGKMFALWHDKQGGITGITDNLSIKDLGDLGIDLTKIDGITDDLEMSIVFHTYKK